MWRQEGNMSETRWQKNITCSIDDKVIDTEVENERDKSVNYSDGI